MIDEQELIEKEKKLQEEIEEYNQERDRIKFVIGKIGGKRYSKSDTVLNIVFLVIIAVLFFLEVTFHLIPAFLSLEIGILLISIKIIIMIHSQQKTNHFQFWVLNSIEYRMNEMVKRIKTMEKQVNSLKGTDEDGSQG
jgi:predicted membrane protein